MTQRRRRAEQSSRCVARGVGQSGQAAGAENPGDAGSNPVATRVGIGGRRAAKGR
jgi:hypothetical protein